ncbi:amino acid permease [Marinicella sp. W31]|uniref:amino acid permease n=1 Tax=Marinicella sp. W31 TaxID=3023713 RepID=UPI003756FA0A
MSPTNQTEKKTQKKMGLWMCISLVVGNMIGSGIFVLPAALAGYGSISIFSWVITASGAIVLALLFGRLSRLIPKVGGPYAYTKAGFEEFAGFLIAWGYWIALWCGNAAVAVAFVGYIGFLLPVVKHYPILGLSTALIAIWFLTVMNIIGARSAGFIQLITAILKVVPLFLIILFGISHIEVANFTPVNVSQSSHTAAIAACATLTLWAFLGLESATVPAGNVANPSKTIPRATIIGTSMAAIIYILITIVAFGVVPISGLQGSSAPLADMATSMWGTIGGILIAVVACISTFGTLNGFTMLAGQIPYAAAKDSLFPEIFTRESKSKTPIISLIVSSTFSSILIAMNFTKGLVDQFVFIVLLATMTTLIPYLFCAVSEFMIRSKSGKAIKGMEFLSLLILSGLGFVYAVWTIIGAGKEVVFYGFILLLLGIPVYVWQKYKQQSAE